MSARLSPDQRNSFLAAVLAWSMDTFDYFILIMVLSDIENDRSFGATKTELGVVVAVTLAMRPLGAVLFGLWADRIGRRVPLIADVLLYSCAGILCAIAPNVEVLLVLRAIYGIGMGGEWGLGAALAMEKLPRARRGFFSGLLQDGYPLGGLLAALAYLMLTALHLNWRWIFILSFFPALVTLLLRRKVTESPAWQAPRRNAGTGSRTTVRAIMRDAGAVRQFAYLVVLMTALGWTAHGAQDVYPSFLKASQASGGAQLSQVTAAWIAVCYYCGAITGSVVFGALSERLGRRRTMRLAAALALLVLPLFVIPWRGSALPVLILGSVLMMFMVQGAWGAIPAYLNEMSPGVIRGLYPGVIYQIGNVLGAPILLLQDSLVSWFRYQHVYSYVLAATIAPALIAVMAVTPRGGEAKGAVLSGGLSPALAPATTRAATPSAWPGSPTGEVT